MEINNDLPVFIVDSSWLVALSSQDDSTHIKAQKISETLDSETVTILPAEVFSETINALWRKVDKMTAINATKSILASTAYSFLETTREIRVAAVEKFAKAKKDVSFTDCLVMAFADHFKTKTILGFDESFSKSGYSLP